MRPNTWLPLGPLALKSESDETLRLEIGGQDSGRDFMTRKLELPPRTRVEADGIFIRWFISTSNPNPGRGLEFILRRERNRISSSRLPGATSGICMDIYLAGWISREEFRRRASLIHEGSRVFQYNQTRTKNLAVSVSDLKPMSELFERVRGANVNGT